MAGTRAGVAVPVSEQVSIPELKDQVAEAGKAVNASWRTRAGILSTAGLLIAGVTPFAVLAIGAAFKRNFGWGPDALKYHAVAAGATGLVFALVGALFRLRKGGLIRTFIGKGNRLSTSKLQMLLWTVAVAYAFFLFIAIVAWTHHATGFDSLNPDYLFLLGGPFAAALAAQTAAVKKLDNSTIQQADATAPGLQDLVEDTVGSSSVSDAQFLVFNIVALAYFFVALVQTATELPNLPDTLVGLTSVSALAYVGGKVTNKNAPTIRTVTIASPMGETPLLLQILGENFVAGSEAELNTVDTKVQFGAYEVEPLSSSASEIQVAVPALIPPGRLDIRVRTSGGTSLPFSELSIPTPPAPQTPAAPAAPAPAAPAPAPAPAVSASPPVGGS